MPFIRLFSSSIITRLSCFVNNQFSPQSQKTPVRSDIVARVFMEMSRKYNLLKAKKVVFPRRTRCFSSEDTSVLRFSARYPIMQLRITT